MGKCCRHFKALSRKNLMVHSRTPVCALFELVLPVALMCIIWVIRMKVPIQKTDLTALEKYKHPVFPGLAYTEKTSWKWDPDAVTDLELDFMGYMNYAPTPPIPGDLSPNDPRLDLISSYSSTIITR